MKKLLLFLAMTAMLYGCGAPAFEIRQLGDKFSDPNAPQGYTGANNRLSSKSSKGGTHIDNKGVYIDPFVYKAADGSVADCGFYVTHSNFEPSDGFRPIEQIIILTSNDDRIELKGQGQDADATLGSWNPVSRQYIGTFTESAVCKVAPSDIGKIAAASWIEVKIVGDNRSQSYDRDEVEPKFITNVRAFYEQHIKAAATKP